MKKERRKFLKSMGTLGLAGVLPLELVDLCRQLDHQRRKNIADVRVLKISGPRTSTPGLNRQYQAQPIHIYPDHRPPPYRDDPNTVARDGTVTHHYVEIETEGGEIGLYGYLDPEAIPPILQQLRNFLIGQNALAIEKIWDLMYRRNRHSRAGHYMMALSAIDNALWDLRGKIFDAPVYELLGGATREEIEVYGSCLGYSVESGKAGPRAKAFFDAGFRHQKWFLPYGPGSGPEGLAKNIALVKEIRESVGDELQLMFDAFMGWDYPFALAWCKAVESYHPYWIEEAFPTNRVNLFAKLSRSTTVPVATGEHFYNRWEVKQFLEADAIQIVQADPEWCGGVSELAKICHLASSFGVKVFPHGHNIHAQLHVVASQSPEVCPLVEYLINYVPGKLHFQKNPLLTENGKIALPTKSGFGIELDEDKIEQQEVLR